MTNRKPIIFEDLVDVRFADLDRYNHVNSKHYIDFVSSSRLTFLQRTQNITMETFAEKGLGFFMNKATTNFKRPITGLQKVRARSHIAEVRDSKVFVIPFELLSEDGSKLFANGVLEFTTVDLQTNKVTAVPEWAYQYFFESAPHE